MNAPEQVRVAGIWLNDLAPWGDLSYSTHWGDGGGGCDEASWSMYLLPLARHAKLVRGALVEIFVGGVRIWLGTLAQVDWSAGTFTADGLSKLASWFGALDGAGASTSVPSAAIDAAIARGLAWSGRSGAYTGTLAATVGTSGPNMLNDLLDANSDFAGQRWSVFEDGVVTFAPDPVTPTWQVAPGLIELGEDDGEYASIISARYLNSATSTNATVTRQDSAAAGIYGPVEFLPDLTVYGAMTTAKATSFADGILAKGRAKMGWTNAITVGPYELTTMGGLPADLSMVRAGQVVRAHGIYDPLNLTPYRDLVIGKASRTVADGTITLEPVDTQPQTLADVTEAVMRAATQKSFKA